MRRSFFQSHNVSFSYSGPEAPTSCDQLECSFGATCIEVSGQAHCECPPPDCDERNKTKVGGASTLGCQEDFGWVSV